MGRMARKDEYNQLIVFLLGSGSSYLNGSIISADGAEHVGDSFDKQVSKSCYVILFHLPV